MDDDREQLKLSIKFILHRDGSFTVINGDKRVHMKRSLSNSSLSPPESVPEPDDKEDLVAQCKRLTAEWYVEQYKARVQTAYDSKWIDGEQYLGRRSSEQLDKERDDYYRTLLEEKLEEQKQVLVQERQNAQQKSQKRRKVDEDNEQEEDNKECFGCVHDKPGQRQHMGEGGCLAGSPSVSSVSKSL